MKKEIVTSLPLPGDPDVYKDWSEEVIEVLMPYLLRRLEPILSDHIGEIVLHFMNIPLNVPQAAKLLGLSVDALRKQEQRGYIKFIKKGARKMITLKSLCNQIGYSVILQQIKKH